MKIRGNSDLYFVLQRSRRVNGQSTHHHLSDPHELYQRYSRELGVFSKKSPFNNRFLIAPSTFQSAEIDPGPMIGVGAIKGDCVHLASSEVDSQLTMILIPSGRR